jgi:hypothetical protein
MKPAVPDSLATEEGGEAQRHANTLCRNEKD